MLTHTGTSSGGLPHRLLTAVERLRQTLWPIGDQLLISGANFVVQVIAARMLERSEFGVFSIVFSGLLLANILQATLVTQPHNVIGSTKDGEEYRRYTTTTALGQLGIFAAELAIVIPLTLIAFLEGWPSAPILGAAIPALLCWQAQEWTRRVLYTEGRHVHALTGDLIAYGGLVVIVAALYAVRLRWNVPVTGATILYTVALTSAIAACYGLMTLRTSLSSKLSLKFLRENWNFGKWLAASELLGWFSSIHMQIWWAALLLGAAQSADLRAAQILFGPARVLALYLATVLPIQLARGSALNGHGFIEARLKSAYLLLIPVTGAYCLAAAVFSEDILSNVYGREYASKEGTLVLSLYSASSFVHYMQIALVAAMMANGQSRQIFFANAWGFCLTLVASPILILVFGAPGATLTVLLSACCVGAILARGYFRGRPGAGAGHASLPLSAVPAEQTRVL